VLAYNKTLKKFCQADFIIILFLFKYMPVFWRIYQRKPLVWVGFYLLTAKLDKLLQSAKRYALCLVYCKNTILRCIMRKAPCRPTEAYLAYIRDEIRVPAVVIRKRVLFLKNWDI
jgi:hypothetical protein